MGAGDRESAETRGPALMVFLLAFGSALGLGVARFGYGLLLPSMREDLDWSYAAAGWINTVNALGYLAGALLSGPMNRMLGLRRTFGLGAFLTVAALLVTGLFHDIRAISLFRFVAGYSGAMVFIAGGALAAGLAGRAPGRLGLIIGLFYAGPGIGIALSGLVVPVLVDRWGAAAWPSVWFVLGGMGLCLALLAVAGLPKAGPAAPVASEGGDAERFDIRASAPLLLAYVCFGIGSIAYMTFMFTHVQRSGLGVAGLSAFWMLIGAAIIVSPWLWARLMGRLHAGRAFAALAAVNATGAILPLVIGGHGAALVSAAIFGAGFLSVVASTTAFVQRNAPRSDYPRAVAVFAVAFGLGQTIGPVLVGWITDRSANLEHGLATGAAFIAASAALALVQRDR